MWTETLYKQMPHLIQNVLITVRNFIETQKRYGKEYKEYKEYLKETEYYSIDEIEKIQEEKLIKFLSYCKEKSPYYQEVLKNIDITKGMESLKEIPVTRKGVFRSNIPKIMTDLPKNLHQSKTGGTTGNSMVVYIKPDDREQRFATLDLFRERFGYELGKKTAWFSGKDLLTEQDLSKNRFWKDDFLNKVRYYSTFNINQKAMPAYIDNLQKFKPEFIVGFPSSVVEIARYGLKNNIDLGFKVKATFPTAETKINSEVNDIIAFFGGGVYDQYASSEGACFITECEHGNLHFESLSGVIEVVDENDQPAKEGRMLITAFHTRGTPLLRYDIGDRMKWSEKQSCPCNRQTPLVEEIQGRINDYIYSKERGKCNLGNVSNCVKYVKGVRKFQVVQDKLDEITVVVENSKEYGPDDEKMFRKELVYRLGDVIDIKFKYVSEIPREKSGKFRFVKNSIQHLVDGNGKS